MSLVSCTRDGRKVYSNVWSPSIPNPAVKTMTVCDVLDVLDVLDVQFRLYRVFGREGRVRISSCAELTWMEGLWWQFGRREFVDEVLILLKKAPIPCKGQVDGDAKRNGSLIRMKVDMPIGVRSSVKHKRPQLVMLRRFVLGLSFPVLDSGRKGKGEKLLCFFADQYTGVINTEEVRKLTKRRRRRGGWKEGRKKGGGGRWRTLEVLRVEEVRSWQVRWAVTVR